VLLLSQGEFVFIVCLVVGCCNNLFGVDVQGYDVVVQMDSLLQSEIETELRGTHNELEMSLMGGVKGDDNGELIDPALLEKSKSWKMHGMGGCSCYKDHNDDNNMDGDNGGDDDDSGMYSSNLPNIPCVRCALKNTDSNHDDDNGHDVGHKPLTQLEMLLGSPISNGDDDVTDDPNNKWNDAHDGGDCNGSDSNVFIEGKRHEFHRLDDLLSPSSSTDCGGVNGHSNFDEPIVVGNNDDNGDDNDNSVHHYNVYSALHTDNNDNESALM